MPSADHKPIILLVDDDETAVQSLSILFEFDARYSVRAFTDPRQAVAEVKRTPIDLVISDYLMPGMTGLELLKEIQETQPDAVSILLTGFADKENTIRAINELDLFQYLEKPWDNDQLLLAVERGLQQKSLRKQLTEKIEEFDQLLTVHRDLQHRHVALERELEMAARVQRSLLPERMPEVGGYEFLTCYHPCREIGGDFYGMYTGCDRSVVMLADVSGHGVQAALSSMLLKALFDEASSQAGSLIELARRLNASLYRFLPTGMYACVSIAWLTHHENAFELVNAGLPFPFVLRADRSSIDEIPIGGTPLGLFGEGGPATFDTHRVTLSAGDVLLLASDGLGEIPGSGDELFQERRMRDVLAGLAGCDGSTIISELVEQGRRFARDPLLPDDLSLLTITRTA